MVYLSIVTTTYCSAPYIEEFYSRISKAAQAITDSYEIIFVNDGSPDESLEIAIELCKMDSKVKVVDLSRNFGHHRAMMTGLRYAQGEKVFLIDCDLEEEPELLVEFHNVYSKNKCDVVYGVQNKRRGNWFEKMTGSIYYWLLKNITGINFPQNIVTARLMSRRYVRSLLRHRERELVIAGLWYITGYTQIPAYIVKSRKNRSNYSFSKKVRLFIDGVVSFTDRPLIFIFYLGVVISTMAGLLVTNLIIRRLVFRVGVEGWTSLIASIWFLGGLIILFLGIIGIYISKIFTEAKQRPLTIVREVYTQNRGW